MDRFFHAELTELRNDIIRMGARSLDMIRLSLDALINSDTVIAGRIRDMDDEVDELEKRIDREALRYLTLFGPVGRDIRLLLAARDITHDLERIADEADGVARRVFNIAERGPVNDMLGVPRMARIAEEQVRMALDSFVDLDVDKAHKVRPGDAMIDQLNRENHRLVFGPPGEPACSPAQVVELLFISKAYERIGDHAKNIGEQVIFLHSGEDIRHTQHRAQRD